MTTHIEGDKLPSTAGCINVRVIKPGVSGQGTQGGPQELRGVHLAEKGLRMRAAIGGSDPSPQRKLPADRAGKTHRTVHGGHGLDPPTGIAQALPVIEAAQSGRGDRWEANLRARRNREDSDKFPAQ